jgi:pyrophosphatase PpaX
MLREIARDEAEAIELRRIYKRVQHGLHDHMVSAFPGIPELVQREVDRGRPRAIVTSKGAPMTERTMAVCGLTGAFPVVVTADHVEHPKPDPEPVRIALDHLGVPVSRRVIFVSDSVHDIESGRAAGVTTLAVTWGAVGRERLAAAGPHHVVDRVEELAALLEGEERERGVA